MVTREASDLLPFSRSSVPACLTAPPPSQATGQQDEQFDIWASLLISRDLPFGPSYSPNNSKCGFEIYNASQFASQFGMSQMIHVPPYCSQNDTFLDRFVLNNLEIEALGNVFPTLEDLDF